VIRIRTAELVSVIALVGASAGAQQLQTTVNDFRMPGTQAGGLSVPMVTAVNCSNCHAYYAEGLGEPKDNEPFSMWSASMMGQSGRDPIFWAALHIANADAAHAGEYCMRCHVPQGWLAGRSSDPTGASLTDVDREGVACSVCHRLVNPEYQAGQSPAADVPILAALQAAGRMPVNPHTAQYIIDPNGLRRGPYELTAQHAHTAVQSPFHRKSELCATCHDISNPLFAKQPDGTYAMTPLNEEAPSHDKHDQFPVERTYSEWLNSSFAQGPIDMGGRFGGNNPLVSSCQDCHMPSTQGHGCDPSFGALERSDLPRHYFAGANTWVLKAIRAIYPDYETELTEASVDAAIARAEEMLDAASDLEVTIANNLLTARIVNQSGHKLPTGYTEGRRMWLNVRFYNENGEPISEYGAYDYATGDLDVGSTKVYEAKAGITPSTSALTGKPVGESFHFALNSQWLFDNRIPPRGFTNAAFNAAGAGYYGYSYPDGQYWDDTVFEIPPTAQYVEVSVLHQTTTREYIEFLRDAVPGNTAGIVSYNLWQQFGREKLALMDYFGEELPARCPTDVNHDGGIDADDVITFFAMWDTSDPRVDFTGDGGVDGDDIIEFFTRWDQGC